MNEYTHGEVLTLAAQILGLEPEDLDNVVIIGVGRCEHCDKRNAFSIIDTLEDDQQFADIITGGVQTRIHVSGMRGRDSN